MHHFELPRRVFRYPVVEYIPLPVYTVYQGPLPEASAPEPAGASVSVFLDPGEMEAYLAGLGISAGSPEAPWSDAEEASGVPAALGIVAREACILGMVYRGHEVPVVLEGRPAWVHAALFPSRYFYKPSLDFLTFGPTGEPVKPWPAASVRLAGPLSPASASPGGPGPGD